MASTKVPLSRLPLPKSSRLLTHNLTPEPVAKTANELVDLLKTKPTTLRKSRAADDAAHFSYMTPLPMPFPYRIAPPPSDVTQEERMIYIEKVLTTQEPLTEVSSEDGTELKKYRSLEREEFARELLSVAPTCLRDCFPNLDVGDALHITGSAPASGAANESSSAQTSARQELIDILSGDTALMSLLSTPGDRGYAPWSLRYSGHQFGSWAGQLGDGRAISILETVHPNDPNKTFELQLKGAGRTPFSRGADGLAVLRSSVREYLVAEAMQALGIPTTRSLALISLPNLPVARESIETAAIVCRVAESFIRIGNFQAANSAMPDTSFMFMGGGGAFAQQPPNYEALRILGEWVAFKVLKLDVKPGEPWGKELLWECARRNALMVAGWQAYGFMHGVMNTDNISIMGLTIDYGPYAFMDVFDDNHICNHTDETGRYAYKYQPTMIVYALRMLLKSLAPLVGAELDSGKAISAGWAEGPNQGKLKTWSAEAEDTLSDELEAYIMGVFADEYWRLMRQRLGLKTVLTNDQSQIFQPLLNLMGEHRMDFHDTFRHLTIFRASWMSHGDEKGPDDPLDNFLKTLIPSDNADIANASKSWLDFLELYADRINREEEQAAWRESSSKSDWEAHREVESKRFNPRFVLRQWVLEEIIGKLQKDAEAVAAETRKVTDPSEARVALNKILDMATRPFEPWGAEGGEVLTQEEREERRLCGTGPKTLLGFQCSCSS